jgi:hypothetical protein
MQKTVCRIRRSKILLVFFFICLLNKGVADAQERSNKRGLAYNIPYAEDLPTLSKGISWFYNWGVNPGLQVIDKFSQYLEYVPMAWNGVNADALRTFKAKYPECQYLLAFNEPNLTDQANMTPTQAAAKWPAVKAIAQELGLKIISPAMNYGTLAGYGDPIVWLDEFFTLVPLSDVDGIAVHCYMNNVPALESFINRFKKYGKPIWLTEFCAYEQNQGLTPDKQKDFMVEAVTYLENDPDVFRYSWFIGRNGGGDNAFPYNSLLTKNDKGVLTELGDIYVNMSSFDKNFYYSVEDTIQAEKFIDSHSASLRRIDANSGNLYLNDFYFKDWASYQINLPENKEYTITFRLACVDGTVLQILDSSGNLLTSSEISSTGGLSNWELRSMQVNLPIGKQQITIKSMGEGCNVDWFTFKDITNAATPTVESPVYRIFPLPVKNILNIEINEDSFEVTVFDMQGRCVYRNSNEKMIDSNNWAQGMYLFHLQTKSGKNQWSKIIKD